MEKISPNPWNSAMVVSFENMIFMAKNVSFNQIKKSCKRRQISACQRTSCPEGTIAEWKTYYLLKQNYS